MPAPLRCPTCTAPLEIPGEPATTMRCTYCGAGVLLTERGGRVEAAASQQRYSDAIHDVLDQLRAGSGIGAIQVYREHFGVGLAEAKYAVERLEEGQSGTVRATRPASAPAARSAPAAARQPRAALAAVVFVVAVSASVGVVAVRGTMETTAAAPGAASPLRGEEGGQAFATEVLRFGGEGNGAGRFQDARTMTVDAQGRLYVAEYGTGRVQMFDSAGTFLTQWILEPERLVDDVEVDRRGTVYVLHGGYIRWVEGTTGRVLGELPGTRYFGYSDLDLAPDGTLWLANLTSIVQLTRNGRVLREIDVSETVPGASIPRRLALSGDGHVYLTDLSSNEIYHLDAGGRFIDRFGTPREPRMPVSAVQDLAFDGRGRLYVSYLRGGIRVYSPEGRQLGTIADGESFAGLAFNDRDELYAVARDACQIVKYRLNR